MRPHKISYLSKTNKISGMTYEYNNLKEMPRTPFNHHQRAFCTFLSQFICCLKYTHYHFLPRNRFFVKKSLESEWAFTASERPKGDVGVEASASSSAEVKVTCTAGTASFLELRRRPNFNDRPRFSYPESQSESLWSLVEFWKAFRKVRLNQDELLRDDPVDLDLEKNKTWHMRTHTVRSEIDCTVK